MTDLHDPINRLLDEMTELRALLKAARLERAEDIATAIKPWQAAIDRMRTEATHWQGKYNIVRRENNALRRKPDNRERKNMALLIARLAHALEKANPDSNLPEIATDYLRRHDLMGSPLR